MQKIKSIQIVNQHNNGKLFEVGKSGVFEILDKSQEYEDHIHSLYYVTNKAGEMISMIENCPVMIDYDVPENQKPVQKELFDESKQEFNFKKELIKLGIDEQLISDWLKVRAKKKTANTETSFKEIKKQIELSGLPANACIQFAVINNWAGLKAEWIKNKNQNGTTEKQSVTDW
jgi:hypothetical protein